MLDVMPISKTGHEKLEEELRKLETEAAELRQRVAEARALGDLKENSEYIYGRQNLGFVEGRMGEIRAKLNHSRVTDCSQIPCDSAGFGTVVTLLNLDENKEIVYQLLGPHDSDLLDNSISILSPIGSALVGRAAGAKFTVNTPRGEVNYELLNIAKSEIK